MCIRNTPAGARGGNPAAHVLHLRWRVSDEGGFAGHGQDARSDHGLAPRSVLVRRVRRRMSSLRWRSTRRACWLWPSSRAVGGQRDLLGSCLALVGDVDGDGTPDLAAGAPQTANHGRTTASARAGRAVWPFCRERRGRCSTSSAERHRGAGMEAPGSASEIWSASVTDGMTWPWVSGRSMMPARAEAVSGCSRSRAAGTSRDQARGS